MSTQTHRSADRVTTDAADRRTSVRVEVLGRIDGEIAALDLPVTLLNLSAGGFLMRVPVEMTIGGSHDFRLSVANQDPILVSARVVHSITATVGGVVTFVVGVEFVDVGAATKQALDSLLNVLQG